MPRKPKRLGPAARRPGFAAISRLVGREPLLADAAGVEADLGRLFARLADLTGAGPEAPRWRQAARLSREVAEGLSDLAAAVADPPHHPRPTRVRVATLHGDDLAAAAARIAQVQGALDPSRVGPAAPVPPRAALAGVWALEGRAVAAPLSRLFALCPTPPVVALWSALAARRRVLETLGATPGNGAGAWPDPPARPPRPVRPGPPAARGATPGANAAPPPPGREWTADGRVERLNRARRCGTVRTQDGQSVFFAARAVSGGLAALKTGDPVTLCLRRGTLGVAAVRVTPQAGPNTPPPPA